MKPTVLVVTTARWFSTARLSIALGKAGFTVDVLCPSRHPVGRTSLARKIFLYHGLTPLRSFAAAILESKPDLIVPSDDVATRHLHDLYQHSQRKASKANIAQVIQSSLGAATSFACLESRTRLIEVAQEEGIRAPRTVVLANKNALTEWISEVGVPTVLKADGTSGGTGVRVVRTVGEADNAFRELKALPSFVRIAKRVLVDRDTDSIRPFVLRQRSVLNAQKYVPGRNATSTVACWQGAVLASLHFEVLKTAYPGGPSTVVRSIENADMVSATEKLARRLHLSGIYGLDFVLEAETGRPYLVEVNPRATQVGHLALGAGHDLPPTLFAAVSGEPVRLAPKVTDNATIAFFPQEWIRDPSSEFLRSAYQDIPWEEPELIRASLSNLPKLVHSGSKEHLISDYLQVHAELGKERSF